MKSILTVSLSFLLLGASVQAQTESCEPSREQRLNRCRMRLHSKLSGTLKEFCQNLCMDQHIAHTNPETDKCELRHEEVKALIYSSDNTGHAVQFSCEKGQFQASSSKFIGPEEDAVYMLSTELAGPAQVNVSATEENGRFGGKAVRIESNLKGFLIVGNEFYHDKWERVEETLGEMSEKQLFALTAKSKHFGSMTMKIGLTTTAENEYQNGAGVQEFLANLGQDYPYYEARGSINWKSLIGSSDITISSPVKFSNAGSARDSSSDLQYVATSNANLINIVKQMNALHAKAKSSRVVKIQKRAAGKVLREKVL